MSIWRINADYGYFIGEVDARWEHGPGEDRKMLLLNDFYYVDQDSKPWHAPAGSIIDGASIPRALWAIIDPYVGDYRFASVVHDVACKEKARSWQAVHRAFYNASRCAGVEGLKALLMYRAVKQGGPRW